MRLLKSRRSFSSIQSAAIVHRRQPNISSSKGSTILDWCGETGSGRCHRYKHHNPISANLACFRLEGLTDHAASTRFLSSRVNVNSALPDGSFMSRYVIPALLIFLLPYTVLAQAAAMLTIDAANPVAKVSPTLYGIMTEEINHSYDGGLYAELVSNRTFQTSRGPSLENWVLIQNSVSRAHIEVDRTTGPSEAISHSLKLTVESAGKDAQAGFYNTGFWGIALQPHTRYSGSFYAKANNIENVTVRLVNDKTGDFLATTMVSSLGNSWRRFEYTLTTGAISTSAENHLEFLADGAGTAWFSRCRSSPRHTRMSRMGSAKT